VGPQEGASCVQQGAQEDKRKTKWFPLTIPVPPWAGGAVSDINPTLEKGGLDSLKPNNVHLPHPGETSNSINF